MVHSDLERPQPLRWQKSPHPLSSENVARFVCDSDHYFAGSAVPAKSTTIRHIYDVHGSDLLPEIGTNGFSHAVI
jgi:hypothetical protein